MNELYEMACWLLKKVRPMTEEDYEETTIDEVCARVAAERLEHRAGGDTGTIGADEFLASLGFRVDTNGGAHQLPKPEPKPGTGDA
jgi:hypothetical protein